MLPHHFGAFCCHPTELWNISYSISAFSLTPSPVFPHPFLLLVHSVSHIVDEHCWHNKGWYVSMHECSQATGMETGMSGEGGRQRWMRGENEEVNNEKEIGWRGGGRVQERKGETVETRMQIRTGTRTKRDWERGQAIKWERKQGFVLNEKQRAKISAVSRCASLCKILICECPHCTSLGEFMTFM